MIKYLFWFSVLLIISCNNQHKTDAKTDHGLKEIIEDNTVALGGADLVDNIEQILVVSIKREANYYDSMRFIADRMGRMRVDIYDLNSQQKERVFAESYDGTKGFQWRPSTSQEDASEKGALALSNTPQYPGHIFQLKDMNKNGHELKLIDTVDLLESKYAVLRLTLKNGFSSFYYVDTSTGLIKKIRSKRALHVDQNPDEQLIEVQLSDHKTVDGIVKPFTIQEVDINHDTIITTTKIAIYEFNPIIEDQVYHDLSILF